MRDREKRDLSANSATWCNLIVQLDSAICQTFVVHLGEKQVAQCNNYITVKECKSVVIINRLCFYIHKLHYKMHQVALSSCTIQNALTAPYSKMHCATCFHKRICDVKRRSPSVNYFRKVVATRDRVPVPDSFHTSSLRPGRGSSRECWVASFTTFRFWVAPGFVSSPENRAVWLGIITTRRSQGNSTTNV
jgi:hypothetical protein